MRIVKVEIHKTGKDIHQHEIYRRAHVTARKTLAGKRKGNRPMSTFILLKLSAGSELSQVITFAERIVHEKHNNKVHSV